MNENDCTVDDVVIGDDVSVGRDDDVSVAMLDCRSLLLLSVKELSEGRIRAKHGRHLLLLPILTVVVADLLPFPDL